jgi:hypothetical protein
MNLRQQPGEGVDSLIRIISVRCAVGAGYPDLCLVSGTRFVCVMCARRAARGILQTAEEAHVASMRINAAEGCPLPLEGVRGRALLNQQVAGSIPAGGSIKTILPQSLTDQI